MTKNFNHDSFVKTIFEKPQNTAELLTVAAKNNPSLKNFLEIIDLSTLLVVGLVPVLGGLPDIETILVVIVGLLSACCRTSGFVTVLVVIICGEGRDSDCDDCKNDFFSWRTPLLASPHNLESIR